MALDKLSTSNRTAILVKPDMSQKSIALSCFFVYGRACPLMNGGLELPLAVLPPSVEETPSVEIDAS